jgi:hypothetical protein
MFTVLAETTVEVLPRLCKIKYDSGITEELLFVDLPNEYCLSSGQLVLEYGKAIQESVFQQLRVVRDGQLRIIFSADLKIMSWEFCARSHEELLPRRLIIPQVNITCALELLLNFSATMETTFPGIRRILNVGFNGVMTSGDIFGSHCSEVPDISVSKWRGSFSSRDADQLQFICGKCSSACKELGGAHSE